MATQSLIDSGALSAMDNDALLSRREAWADVLKCVLDVAELNTMRHVSAGWVRDHYAERTRQYKGLPGRVWRDLTDRGILTTIPGSFAPSGNREAGNTMRMMPIYECNTTALRALIEKEKMA